MQGYGYDNISFLEGEWINKMKEFPKSNSQAGQEAFVLNCLKEKKNGWYVEIGSNDPITWNNTYLLETEYNWKGVGFEIVPELVDNYNSIRKNKCICADATVFDYKSYFQENKFPKQIDYLQVDIEPASNSLSALYKLPHDEYRFSVITFEHDVYVHPNNILIKAEAKGMLKSLGYELVVEDVDDGGNIGRIFEDWWIDPSVINLNK